MRKLYIKLLIWTGIFKRFDTKKRVAMLRELGYNPIDNTELNELLAKALKQAKEHKNESTT